MSNFEFIQVNNRNLNETVDFLNGKKAIGFEVINSTIIELLDVNVDPQHTGIKQFTRKLEPENKSAALWVLGVLPTIDPNYQTTVVFEKVDIDAIAAATLWLNSEKLAAMENDPQNHDTFLALCNRVKEIDQMDCGMGGQGIEWDPNYFSQQLIKEVSDFNVLGCMCSDFKLPVEKKLEIMFDWLTSGKLPENYKKQVADEMSAQKESQIQVLNCNGTLIRCVTSKSRGISNLIYSVSPFGVGFNPEFPTKDGTIRKFTIMQFNNKYLNLQGILDEISQQESGWGGNIAAGVIGSPFAGTNLSCETVCKIVARHVI